MAPNVRAGQRARSKPAAEVLGADASAIRHHYDVGNDFYATWLDPSMTYSCALYGDGVDDLARAQMAKLDHYLDRLDLPVGGRLLDVGCGWGSLLARAVDRRPDITAVGLTLSDAQVAHVRATHPSVRVRAESWADHRPDAAYDGVVSLGAFEHFASFRLTPDQRHGVYSSFFRACHRLTAGTARLGLQTIGLESDTQPASRSARFLTEEIFPDSSVPRLSEIISASEPFFRVTSLRVDGEHYARTCRAWRRRLMANEAAALSVSSPETVARYRKYLCLSEHYFQQGATTLFRFVFARRLTPLAPTSEACP
jgi:cyclopropane-fatty-acyl-phospholipid synthase